MNTRQFHQKQDKFARENAKLLADSVEGELFYKAPKPRPQRIDTRTLTQKMRDAGL